ncbi:hypothetical protein Rhal01_00748 [Rubritalea halochordaticola]|uniref:Cytochrome c domain-containing protein n=1 Tax=Rubritalea halochordaticola TaxID=714537 RepID=A0ABP9V0I1_9BACT
MTMPRTSRNTILLSSLLLSTTAIPLSAQSSFEEAASVLSQHCISCHGPDKSKGGLRLDNLEAFLEGGDNEDAISMDSPLESHLLKVISLPHDHDDIMPPKGRPLNQEEIKKLREWFSAKAPWPEGATIKEKKSQPSVAKLTKNLEKLSAFPSKISLESASDYHSIIIYGHYKDDTTKELTDISTYTLTDPSIAKIEGNKLTPLKDGTTSIQINLGEHKVLVPLSVKDADKERPISFQLDVMPVLTAAGCNTGSCHGSARGQDGFHLSLFGFDPKGDHHRLTKELPGRRLNLAIPEESLLLTKAAGQVPHTGGKILLTDSPGYATLLKWIQSGAKFDKDDIPHPTSIEVEPKQIVTKGSEERSRFTVRAKYSDGTDRDVTELSTFTTSNDNSLSIVPKTYAQVESKKRGEAFIMARFHTFTEGSQGIVIPAEDHYSAPAIGAYNYIDEHIHRKLGKLHITPSDVCSDEVFVRRVYLDILGKLPTPEQRTSFLANQATDKRSALVDHLLEQPEFTDIWVMKWAELLQIRTFNNEVSYKAAILYHTWLREQIASNRPFNLIVKDIISAKGGTFANPPTNFYQIERDNLKLTENVAQVFMGTRIQCAQCHNHPFDRWTMDDYYGFAAFFSEVKRKQAEDPREQIIFDGRGDVKHPVTKENVKPRFLGGGEPEDDRRKRREHIADWLTSPDNPWFARNVSNIMWDHFFGIGIVNPVDDVRVSNPPSNPELLDDLAQHFVDYDYDFRRLVRDICTSRTYQLSTQVNDTNQSDTTNFSHAIPRRLRAEVLLDTISQVTNTPNKFKGLPKGAKAVRIADGNTSTYFLTTFGRATRQTVCSCEVKLEPNLSQALHLLNGESTNNRIRQGKIIQQQLDAKKTNQEIITHLYLTTLTREPTAKELNNLQGYLKEANERNQRQAILEDIFWALLNSKEFIFNH